MSQDFTHSPESLLPWPTDAIMVIAQRADGFDLTKQKSTPISCSCRHCGHALYVGAKAISEIASHPGRGLRPVKFFCILCAVLHDASQVEVLIDLNARHTPANPSLN